MIAEVAEGEIAGAAEEPGAGMGDFLPMGVQFEKGVLDDIFGSFALAQKSVGVAEQWGFFRVEDLPECGFCLHRVLRRAD
jgi:hypothetical protein